ncbi:MAG: hypothetical protein DHS20C18_20840 [Saprospiraceae bacterium]|nr:MAG: hypothetical protein DHS20C18_20840 [Saprospiraceae bacterium]
MIKRDHLLRWTQELAKVIARLMGKETLEALDIIDDIYDGVLEFSPSELDRIPPETWWTYLTIKKSFHEGQLDFLAELLYRQGTLLHKSSQLVESKARLQQALHIFERLDKEQAVFSFERQQQLVDIRKQLEDLNPN